MKIKILFVILIITSSLVNAQRPVAGVYYINNYINKFEGTWIWTQGNDSVIIKLKKIKRTNSQPISYDDVLVGCHKYVKNGQVIENSLDRFDTIIINNGRRKTILGSNYAHFNDTSKVECSIRDITKYTTHKLIFQWVSGTPETCIWTLRETEGFLVDPRQQAGLTLPANLVLTKQ